jgi:hypothetical protein
MSVPSAAGLGLHLRETGARRWIRNANEMMARWAFDLSARELRFALQRLIAVGTIEFEIVCVHSLHPHHAQTGREKYMELFSYFLSVLCACRIE